jgi:nitrous oxide reductase
MSETNRRKFLAAAGVGAAAGVVGVTAGPAFASGGAVRSSAAAKETVVAYVEDHHGSTVTLLVGEREVVVHDKDLVARLNHAAKG